jgi:hypothetical protein
VFIVDYSDTHRHIRVTQSRVTHSRSNDSHHDCLYHVNDLSTRCNSRSSHSFTHAYKDVSYPFHISRHIGNIDFSILHHARLSSSISSVFFILSVSTKSCVNCSLVFFSCTRSEKCYNRQRSRKQNAVKQK